MLERTNTKTSRYHGDLGLLTWDALCLSLVLGLLEFLRLSTEHLLVVALILVNWMAVHSQMRRKSPDLEYLATSERDAAVAALPALGRAVEDPPTTDMEKGI